MPGKKDKGEADIVAAGKTDDDNGEYKSKENLKIKEILKKLLIEEKGIDEKYKAKINTEMNEKVDECAKLYDEETTIGDYFTKMASRHVYSNNELNVILQ